MRSTHHAQHFRRSRLLLQRLVEVRGRGRATSVSSTALDDLERDTALAHRGALALTPCAVALWIALPPALERLFIATPVG